MLISAAVSFLIRTRKYWVILATLIIICYAANYLVAKVTYASLFELYQPSDDKRIKILLVWGDGTGEREEMHRLQIVAQRLGIDLKVASTKSSNLLHRHYVKDLPTTAAKIMQPDLIITIERDIQALQGAPNYLVLDQSIDTYVQKLHAMTILDLRLHKFSGLLPTFPELTLLQDACEGYGLKPYIMQWYPTVYKTDYHPQYPKYLFYPGGVIRDVTRSSSKYKNIFSVLDQKGYLAVYGPKAKWKHAPNSIREPLPFDGVSLLAAQNEAGVTLILHDAGHLNGNVPTGRIFEAVAANTVIISDKLPFIQEHFGDNILYIDVEQDAEEVAKQIDDHMQWIFSNPKTAMQMAQNCNDIFVEKFTLEQQMQKLLELRVDAAKE